jgi:5-methylcytosine-specific restriction enzyme subunit McrC
MNTIRVFEYEYLYIDHKVFKTDHYNALAAYNDALQGKFFTLHLNAVRFLNFVGVIQAGDLTIEILPKVNRSSAESEKDTWQKVLLEMLRQCNWMKVHAHEKASLQYKFNSILEAYLELFLRECEILLNKGLIKKYKSNDNNLLSLKGKLLFGQHIQKNNIHQERFFTRHQIYTENNHFNQILLKAIKLIPAISTSPLLRDRVYRLLFAFPVLDDIAVNEATFQNLAFNRKTADYREAIEMAAMLLLNYRPDISSGPNHVLAILFDMNDLWEEYVYRQLLQHNTHKWTILPQQYKTFWTATKHKNSKGVKPDIVIHMGDSTLIIDTKWKLPQDNLPADSDLKQMFVYNEYWQSAIAILLYPKASSPNQVDQIVYDDGGFRNLKATTQPAFKHFCGLMKANILDAHNNLNPIFGIALVKRINELVINTYANNEHFNNT